MHTWYVLVLTRVGKQLTDGQKSSCRPRARETLYAAQRDDDDFMRNTRGGKQKASVTFVYARSHRIRTIDWLRAIMPVPLVVTYGRLTSSTRDAGNHNAPMKFAVLFAGERHNMVLESNFWMANVNALHEDKFPTWEWEAFMEYDPEILSIMRESW